MALACGLAEAQDPATWIWSPGDFEIWLSNRMQVQRVERDVAWPPFWRLYNHQPQVNFIRQVDLAAPEDIDITVEGIYNIAIDGQFVHGDQRRGLATGRPRAGPDDPLRRIVVGRPAPGRARGERRALAFHGGG